MKSTENRINGEELAMQEIDKTDVNPGLARVITVCFLLFITAVPLLQFRSLWPDVGWSVAWSQTDKPNRGFFTRLFYVNTEFLRRINLYEDKLEESSILRKKLLGPVQSVMLDLLGLGNETVYPGMNGWLYFRPAVDYITGPGFLDAWRLRQRAFEGNEFIDPVQPDPRKAIISFHEDLSRRGIRLVLIPVPGKASVHPEHLSDKFSFNDEVLQNSSFLSFIEEVRAAGVMVMDPVPVIQQLKRFSGMPQYLKTDTHWKPGAMELFAESVAAAVEREVQLGPRLNQYSRRTRVISNAGDLVRALNLGDDQDVREPEQVSIRMVYDKRTGARWEPSRSAEVLVIGDSFSNIYSAEVLGWGSAAGFVEQLSFFLQRPVDSIIQNDDGAYAARKILYEELFRDPGRLDAIKVVLWEFATRELCQGDWRLF